MNPRQEIVNSVVTACPISGVTEQPAISSELLYSGGELVLKKISLSSTVSSSRYTDALSLYLVSSANEFSQSLSFPIRDYRDYIA